MSDNELSAMAHLMRRAGFGATRAELDQLVSKGYDAVVDDLINPERFPEIEEDLIDRYYGGEGYTIFASIWIFRMLNTKRPLEEKMALFWHHVFATGITKNQHVVASVEQINTFRKLGLSNMRDILISLSKDPAMIFWLDNNENHNGEPNENFGRELLELFSMGVGNYTENDIKDASRAFTGWTFTQPSPLYPNGYYPSYFVYDENDHDQGEKTFLGQTGNLNGDDIIDIVVDQPATARFISRHIYNFFVADEPQVPSWSTVPPRDPDAIKIMVDAYMNSGGEIRPMLKALFNSDSFKNARFKKVKSPVELVTGVIKLVGTYTYPDPGILQYSTTANLMGQQLYDPPTVEGWHTGHEWIDGGTLNERVNFAVNEVGDLSKPGIVDIVDRIAEASETCSPDDLLTRCMELAGPLEVAEGTRSSLMRYADAAGELRFNSESDRAAAALHISRMIQLIVSTREYQLA
ncbi:MAG: DUF1800 domain-containing protein [Chloroflexi bacterium]|nr:DUF1800 domain-containing protein [Chloroflexota bacterium]